MFDRYDKHEIVQDDIDDDPHQGGMWFKILGNRDYVIQIWFLISLGGADNFTKIFMNVSTIHATERYHKTSENRLEPQL